MYCRHLKTNSWLIKSSYNREIYLDKNKTCLYGLYFLQLHKQTDKMNKTILMSIWIRRPIKPFPVENVCGT